MMAFGLLGVTPEEQCWARNEPQVAHHSTAVQTTPEWASFTPSSWRREYFHLFYNLPPNPVCFGKSTESNLSEVGLILGIRKPLFKNNYYIQESYSGKAFQTTTWVQWLSTSGGMHPRGPAVTTFHRSPVMQHSQLHSITQLCYSCFHIYHYVDSKEKREQSI